GSCPANFNPKTCWDEKERKFADSDPNNSQVNLPAGSSAFVYQTDSKGLAYDLCSTMESGYIQGLNNGSCNIVNNYHLTELRDEHAPQFIGVSLPTINSGLEFVGFVKATDQDGDDLIWTFDFQPSFAPANQWSSWGDGKAPTVSNSPNENEKKIIALKTGKRGSYVFTAKISDGKASTTQIFTITVVNFGPVVLSTDREYVASTTNPLNISFKVYDLITDYPLGRALSYGVSFLESSVIDFFEKIAPDNKEYLFSFSGIIKPDNTSNIAGVYPFTLNVNDQYGATTSKEFNIKVVNNPPMITVPLGCQQSTRQNNLYQACQIKATDVDGNLVNKFVLTQAALGVSIDNNGLIQGAPTTVGIQPIEITATDEYGATSQAVSYDMHVNNYCGDGVRQNQNTEGRGGVNDNGQEQCDGSDNVAFTPGESSFTMQYSCSGTCPIGSINCGGCLSVGGWCGDGGTPQFSYGEGCDFGLTNGFICSAAYGSSCAYCDGICQWQTEIGPYCGNGVKDGPEQCDTGSSNGVLCTAPYGGSCLYCDASCHSQTIQGLSCGDGIVSNGEQCDGVNVSGNTCAALGFTGGTLSCATDCSSLNTANCYNQICGNNVAEGSEACDGSDLKGKTCAALGYNGGSLSCSGCSFVTSNCCSTNLAGIQVCADNWHQTYFNGAFIGTSADWHDVTSYSVTVQPGKNVIAFKASDAGGWWGVSLTLNRSTCNNMTTNDLSNWKCSGTPGASWEQINYDDSSWPAATFGYPGTVGVRPGNYMSGISQIWASGYGEYATVYCRYTFMY
ncbi:hypothetical protein L6270_01980, partial [Candidatus Parcubacteria bacterium]|nr:hypothetical protein [Patescibacteria group bacterium]MBU4309424.1 hypothetical protein [Patescibacteria group bacterium]MBU4432733.1 hypothetical protein [Patescibacteria group bacterium]MBU4577785.1 hypothetical protein [Patescibacteria group bacterium]MCG2696778.1 hypothetical protein [Candidatus Parcubacteria bacterium]